MVSAGMQWREYFQYLKQRMVRQKETDPGDLKTELRRCLSTPELTCLGVGNTIGVGIYVLLGEIAKEHAGPSTILCFVIAIAVTMLNALVYSEFSSSVTQTGASYTFLYKVCGEFLAFICGWLMIISSLCSACVGARAWSALLDSFFDHSIQNFSKSTFGEIQFGGPFAGYLDVTALVFQVFITVIVSCNVRCSSILTTMLSIITVSVLLFVAGSGLIFGDVANFINKDHGGFFPFGISGVIKGSSLAVYACSGFEVVSMSAEEAKNPQKSVPRATILELITVALVYVSAAVGLLFLMPYWLIDPVAPLPSAFDYKGMVWGKFIVTLGPLFSFTNLQMLNLFGISRMLYRMASDGLFFKFFLRVHKKTGVPVNSIACIGVLTSILSLMLDLSLMIEITILLMLITYMFLGSALIKLKVTKPKSYTVLENGVESSELSSWGLTLKSGGDRKPSYSLVRNGSLNNLFDDNDEANNDTEVVINGNDNSGAITSAANNSSASNANRISEDSVSNINDNNANSAVSFGRDSNNVDHEKMIEEDDSDSEGDDEEDVLFRKDFDSNSKKNSTRHHNNHNKNVLSNKNTSKKKNTVYEKSEVSLRETLAEKCSPFIPGVLSMNTVIFMHWLCCVGLAIQINYGWRDLLNTSIVALLAISLLLFVLVVLTVVLWTNKIQDSSAGFQTPLMPLIPTLSIVFSCILFFSSAKRVGFIEMGVLVIVGSILYFILIFLDMQTNTTESQDAEQSLSLIRDDLGSDNDEL